MAAAKKAAAKSAANKGGSGASAPPPPDRPENDEERARVRKTGVLQRDEQRSELTPGQHPDRLHPSNMVEVESMRFSRGVDGRTFGPFGPDAPREKRMVPVSLQVSLNLPLAKKPSGDVAKRAGSTSEGDDPTLIDSGKGVQRLSGIEIPPANPDQIPPTEDEINAAAEENGRTTEDLLRQRQEKIDALRRAVLVQSGAIEGSPEERARLGSTKERSE